jgi:hypothetical protein
LKSRETLLAVNNRSLLHAPGRLFDLLEHDRAQEVWLRFCR